MEEKSRVEVLAERRLRKAAKQSKKKGPNNQQNITYDSTNVIDNIEKNLSDLKISDKILLSPSGKICSQNQCTESTLTTKKVPQKVQANATSDVNKGIILNADEKSGEGETSKSKAQLKAERRAVQETQRALKVQKKTGVDVKIKSPETTKTKKDVEKKKECNAKVVKMKYSNEVKMVSHLYVDTNIVETDISKKLRSGIHKAVVKLGVLYKNKVIIGSNARVVAFLNTLKQVLVDFNSEHTFSREFESVLESSVQYLRMCRPPSVSMTNAAKHFKWHLLQLPNNITNAEAQIRLREMIDEYIKDQIDVAGKAICITVQKKISQDDVILTFGYSSLIERILVESYLDNMKFRVIIVDAGPLFEGKELLRRLVKNGLDCVYVLLSATSYIMKEATKVLLGAHALLTNGYVMSRAGSSQVALIARSYNVPVLVCCETHKFSERVQTDALVYNELGDGEKLIKADSLKSNNHFKALTLMYDVTPPDLVTAVVTEFAILPCTSVPVVLRVKPANPTLT